MTAFFTKNPAINLETLKTEEFSDLFESVIRRVLQTKSREKHIRFRDVLLRQIHQPNDEIENAETYLDLIGTLNEPAIWILNEHPVFIKAYEAIDPLTVHIPRKLYRRSTLNVYNFFRTKPYQRPANWSLNNISAFLMSYYPSL